MRQRAVDMCMGIGTDSARRRRRARAVEARRCVATRWISASLTPEVLVVGHHEVGDLLHSAAPSRTSSKMISPAGEIITQRRRPHSPGNRRSDSASKPISRNNASHAASPVNSSAELKAAMAAACSRAGGMETGSACEAYQLGGMRTRARIIILNVMKFRLGGD